ncbi:hypothetical protein FF125_14400 [Aureibaculum algae]|uniref:Lipocalin-like domain-containing protein n=1 Tax=Aureibaculum algae TaxID=2584122 RepID=A0A5B7TW60_9FLAO|nr:hypothetical protein [Aureibaculum algae]QCX39573.1 hypothetical protein FF125_14400 [Aureibaculum algae]
MKSLKFTVLLLPFILLITSCSSSKWLEGKWEGTGNQVSGETWEVNLNYTDKEHISIKYPDLSCGGVWTLLKENKKEIVFKENIAYGISNCDQGVEAFVSKINENTIKVEYYLRAYDSINPLAEATLYKSTKKVKQ